VSGTPAGPDRAGGAIAQRDSARDDENCLSCLFQYLHGRTAVVKSSTFRHRRAIVQRW